MSYRDKEEGREREGGYSGALNFILALIGFLCSDCSPSIQIM